MSTAGSQDLADKGPLEFVRCSQCRFWALDLERDFTGRLGPLVGECKSPLVLDAYKDEYDPRGVFLHEEGGYTGTQMTGPEYGCLNGRRIL